jgi:hypothetical protein
MFKGIDRLLFFKEFWMPRWSVLLVFLSPLSQAETTVDAFWANLEQLCGQAFEGRLIASPEGHMAGDRLVMHVRDCQAERIRIPFVVGDNLSRTWVLRRVDGRVELRHDHRHPDGSPETVTQYGGLAPNRGSAHAQIFPADDRTLDSLPDNYPNVWLMEVHPGEKFVYYVRRQATDRYYHVEFDLGQPVEAPPAPWGWKD